MHAGVCLERYREFIERGSYKVSNSDDVSCFSVLLQREVAPGEEVRLGDIMPSPRLNRVFNDPLDLLVGGWPTPLLKIADRPREAYAKLEWYNPFSASVKDRTVYYLLKSVRGDRLVEVSSGNVAVAMAAVGNVLGKKVKIYLPSAGRYVTPFLDFLGAEWQVLDVSMTVEALEHLEKDIREGAVHPNQFGNDINFVAHLRTAAEIDWQLSSIGKKPDYVVAGVGTSGHASALGFYFGVRYGAKLIAVQPRDWIPGIRRVESGMKWIGLVPAEIVDVSLAEALQGVRDFAKKYGLLIGPSSGAVYAVYARSGRDGVYVLVFPDNLFKYSSLLQQL
ncbi:MAG: pyridoxal-phosphate dependent enzyme [Pyrobaculum sp.]